MEYRTIFAYSYRITGNERVISEIENMISDSRWCINWYSFKSGDFYFDDDDGNRYVVSVDHNARTVVLKEL